MRVGTAFLPLPACVTRAISCSISYPASRRSRIRFLLMQTIARSAKYLLRKASKIAVLTKFRTQVLCSCWLEAARGMDAHVESTI